MRALSRLFQALPVPFALPPFALHRSGQFVLQALAALLIASPASAARKLVDAPPPPEVQEQAESLAPLTPPPGSRGAMLYENHCTACHESTLHVRERRTVRTQPQLREQVARWATHEKLGWHSEDIAEVASWLDAHYYHFSK